MLVNRTKKIFRACDPPSDSVSGLEFSPKTVPWIGLCAASWDHTVRIWKVEPSSEITTPKGLQKLTASPLDVSWNGEGNRIYACDSLGGVFQWDLQANHVSKVGSHASGVRACHWLSTPNASLLMTGSWDKTAKFWDLRTPSPVVSIDLPERCYAADVSYPMAVVACAPQTIVTYCLTEGPVLANTTTLPGSPQQVRSVAIFHNSFGVPAGWAAVTTRGMMYVMKVQNQFVADYALRCHVSEGGPIMDVYAVNDVRVHPTHQTLATGGSDGIYHFWDREKQQKLYTSTTMDQPITKCAISAEGHMFAYALGYDWAKGHENVDPLKEPQICLRTCWNKMKPQLLI
ncbi:protein Rae1 [Drosophila obscura]|uniref:protein Rae1 n=1 Tax=Drosophila obscura TaxID=7282 RepID=UPI001BB231C0|nr:protein Rae1 [Drosophila obscura]